MKTFEQKYKPDSNGLFPACPKREYLFKEWDEYSSYILGYFLADGHFEKERYLRFEVCDDNLLKKIKHLFNSEDKIVKRKNRNTFYLRIKSKKDAEVLKDMGIGSYKLDCLPTPPKDIKTNHFLRGFWDGDGSVHQKDDAYWVRFFSNSKNFIEWIDKHLLKEIRVRGKIYKKETECWELRYGHAKAKKIVDYIYPEDIKIWRQSKKERLDKAIDKSRERPYGYTIGEVEYLIDNKDKPIEEQAKKLNRSYDSIVVKRCSLRKNNKL